MGFSTHGGDPDVASTIVFQKALGNSGTVQTRAVNDDRDKFAVG
jgi:hypothetical protein